MKQKNTFYFLIFLQALICTFTIIFFNGTADAGDSLVHYLFAKHAPYHPALYFDHWAKPVFVLLASPFAQMGFVGVKIFNSLISLLTIFFTYKSAQLLKLANPLITVLIIMFAPLNYILTFSGLTEPLFALFIITSIYCCLQEKFVTACIIISFLPYVRSEGLIIIGVFGLYFLIKKNWQVLPYLLTGSLVYSLAGFFVYHDLLWIFTKMPYVTLEHVYGSGSLFHFADKLIYVLGVPLYGLFWIGLCILIFKVVKKKAGHELTALILYGFLSFFIAHSLFWYLGIFGSYGLKRVMIGIMPILTIIILFGFNFITETFFEKKLIFNKTIKTVLILYMLIFPFTPNPAAIQWKKDMTLTDDEILVREVSSLITKNNPIIPLLVYNHHYISVALNIDPFDEHLHKKISKETVSNMKPGEILIWDNIYAGQESDITKTEIDSLSGLTNIYFKRFKSEGPEIIFSAYQKK